MQNKPTCITCYDKGYIIQVGEDDGEVKVPCPDHTDIHVFHDNALPSRPTHDAVNHPSHYTSHPSGIECIDVVRHMTFNIGNAIKYMWRAGLKVDLGWAAMCATEVVERAKEKQIEDLEKARWYIDDEIKRLGK